MKALTVQQPWAHAIAHLGKRIENRVWAPPAELTGEVIAIHAGAKWLDPADHPWPWPLRSIPDRADVPYGAIVALAQLGLTVESSDDPWFYGPFGWRLSHIVPLQTPVPCKGGHRLWTVPAAVERKVWRVA